MKYLLMIYHNEDAFNALSQAEVQAMYGEFAKLRAQLESRGAFLGHGRLQPTKTATTVRTREGKDLVTDGPFAETHEALGGYILLDVNSADEAIAVAKQIPIVRLGTIEVRALMETPVAASA